MYPLLGLRNRSHPHPDDSAPARAPDRARRRFTPPRPSRSTRILFLNDCSARTPNHSKSVRDAHGASGHRDTCCKHWTCFSAWPTRAPPQEQHAGESVGSRPTRVWEAAQTFVMKGFAETAAGTRCAPGQRRSSQMCRRCARRAPGWHYEISPCDAAKYCSTFLETPCVKSSTHVTLQSS